MTTGEGPERWTFGWVNLVTRKLEAKDLLFRVAILKPEKLREVYLIINPGSSDLAIPILLSAIALVVIVSYFLCKDLCLANCKRKKNQNHRRPLMDNEE